MVAVDDLTGHGKDGWRVVPVPPAQEVKISMLTQKPEAGPLMFLMEREF